MTEKRRWLLLLGAGLLLLAVGLRWAISYRSASSRLISEREAIRSRGEPLYFSDLASLGSSEAYAVGDRVRVALEGLEPYPYLTKQFTELLETNPPPGDYPAFREMLEKHGDVVEDVVVLAREPSCRFRYDFQTRNPWSIELPELEGIRSVCRLLLAENVQCLGTGRSNQAIGRVGHLFDVAKLIRGDPILVCQMVRISIGECGLNRLESSLACTELSLADFDGIDRRLSQIESSLRLAPAIRADRALLLTILENIGSESLGNILNQLNGRGISDVKLKNWWWGSLFYRSRLLEEEELMLQHFGCIAEAVDVPGPEGKRRFADVMRDVDRMTKDSEGPLSVIFPNLSRCRDQGLLYRQRLMAARFGLRVARYRAEHGRLPEKLQEVLDAGLTAIPPGLLSGQEPQYELLPDGKGFVIRDADGSGDPPAEFSVRYDVSQASESQEARHIP